MSNPAEVVQPHNPAPAPIAPAPGTPPQGVEMVTMPKAEADDLRYRAEASSQNFERLKKEQEKVTDLEAQIIALKAQPNGSGQNDEAIGKLEAEVASLKQSQAKSEVLEAHPMLKEVWADFEKYHADDANKGMSLKTAAKAFLTEKGLLDPQRQGLERPTGGDRIPPSSGMTTEEVKHLRETDYKRYRELVKKGIIT